jgi:hypothetical protein
LKTHGRLSLHHHASSWISSGRRLATSTGGATADADNAIGPERQPPSFTFVEPVHPAITRVMRYGTRVQNIRTDVDTRVVFVRHGADCRRIEHTCARSAQQQGRRARTVSAPKAHPHVNIRRRAPEETIGDEPVDECIARKRIEAPEPLDLSLRQIETRDLFILSTDQVQPIRGTPCPGEHDEPPYPHELSERLVRHRPPSRRRGTATEQRRYQSVTT